jgi:GAF domain-containing protein
LPAEPIELPIKCDNRALGRFVLRFEQGSRPSELRRQVAVILANQVGDALSREQQFSSRQRRFAVN